MKPATNQQKEPTMRWKDLYSGFGLVNPQNQPDSDTVDYFARMSAGQRFSLSPYHIVNDEDGEDAEVIRAPEYAKVKILSVQVDNGMLCMVVTFVGIVPRGINRGTYTLKRRIGELDFCVDLDILPDEMFENAEDYRAPEVELEVWRKGEVELNELCFDDDDDEES